MAEENAPETTQEVVEGEVQETTTDTASEATEVEETPVEDTTNDVAGETDEASRWREAKKKADREAKNLRDRLRKFEEAEEQRTREAMSQAEQLEADKTKAETELAQMREQAESATKELQSLRVRQEATSKALNSGAKQERLEAILRLTDLDDATDEEGKPDSKAIETAIKATLKAYPEFKSGSKDIGGPTNPGTDAPNGSKSVANMTDEELAQLSQRVQWGERVTFP